MNYLGHMLLSHERSEAFQFGAMAPDFAGMHGARIIEPSPHAELSQQYRDFYEGVAFHAQTDITFDQNEKLLHTRKEFYQEISPWLKQQGFRQSFLVAKVGLDLLIDGVVQQHWPEVNIRYRRLMEYFGGVAVSQVFSSPESFNEMRPVRIKEGPPNYANPEVVARILHWRVHKRKRSVFSDTQLPLVSESLRSYSNFIQQIGHTAIMETAKNLDVQLPQVKLSKK